LCTQEMISRMVELAWGNGSLVLTELSQVTYSRAKKVGSHKRKAGGQTYESPRVILGKHYKRFIGQRYKPYRGRATVKHNETSYGKAWEEEGECIVLFFPKRWNEPDEEG